MRLAVHESGPADGPAVIALHGVMQTHDTVMKGDELQRAGYRVIAYDARGHGGSETPDDPTDYGYDRLVEDLVQVMDEHDASPAVLVGVSMGALTSLRLALEQPERVAGIVAVTPAYNPDSAGGCLNRAELVAEALRQRDAELLIAAEPVGPADGHRQRALLAFARRTAERTIASHRDPAATAIALLAILRARAFDTFEPLAAIEAPTVVIGSHDEFDLNHPLWLAEQYARALPGCRWVCEEKGELPIAWKGREVARIALELAESVFDRPAAALTRSAG